MDNEHNHAYQLNMLYITLTCVCAARGKAISFVCYLSSSGTKIIWSRDLGIWATHKHNESVKILLHYATSVVNTDFYLTCMHKG